MEIRACDVLTFMPWCFGPEWADWAAEHPLLAVLRVAVVMAVAALLMVLLRRASIVACCRVVRLGLLAAAGAAAVKLLFFVGRITAGRPGWVGRFHDRLQWVLDQLSQAGGVLQSAGAWLLGPGWTGWVVFGWAGMLGVVLLVMVVFGWLIAALRSGPAAGWRHTENSLARGLKDLSAISWGRIAALAALTLKESLRRRVLIVFGVLLLVFMLGGWFLDPRSPYPVRLYVGSVLPWVSYVVLLLALLLSALSLPADIRSRNLHTVVTKPVRHSEVVAGRALGFVCVGTAFLAVMGTINYVFVIRGLSHGHQVAQAQLDEAVRAWAEQGTSNKPAAPVSVQTTKDQGHKHTFLLPLPKPRQSGTVEGVVATDLVHDHWHDVYYRWSEDEQGRRHLVCRLSAPRVGARRPIYGQLEFRDRAGNPTSKGINVGDEWVYRTYVEGGSLSAAVFTFENITPERFPDGLPVEMTLGVFRTYKGDIEKGVPGSLSVCRPGSEKPVEVVIFNSRELEADLHWIPRRLLTPAGEPKDLFRDFVEDGRVEIWLRCVAPRQYLGVAPYDLYLRAGDTSFAANFFKGYLGVWCQMVLIIGFGVMFSTFLSGPVATVATAGALVGGLFLEFMRRLAAHQVYGGGPFEASYRLAKQLSVTAQIEQGPTTTLLTTADRVAEFFLGIVSRLLPPLRHFDFTHLVAWGSDIAPGVLLRCVFQVLGFLVPLIVAGYFFLRMRELSE